MRYLLDTNFLIGLNGLNDHVLTLLKSRKIDFRECAISVISYLEVLGFSGNTAEDIQAFEQLMSNFTSIQLTKNIQQQTISLRRQHKIKLPDAIILATAQVHELELVTFDKKLVSFQNKAFM